MKLFFGLLLTVNLSLGLAETSAQTAPKSKVPTPPLPPGLVIGEDGRLQGAPTARNSKKISQPKKESVAVNNAASGSVIEEPSGAVLPAKKTTPAAGPKP